MAFKYINPGIYTSENPYASNLESFNHSNTGYAICSQSNLAFIPLVLLEQYYEEIYGTFNVYVPASSSSTTLVGDLTFARDDPNTMPYIRLAYNSVYNSKNKSRYTQFMLQYEGSSSHATGRGSLQYVYNTIHRIYFHFKVNSITQVFVDDVLIVDSNSDSSFLIREGYNLIGCHIGTGFYFSNIILSDSLITQNEKIIELPIKSIETNMSESSGVYTANNIGDFLLQTPDQSQLVENYPNHRVTGISNIAFPCYTDGSPSIISSRDSDNYQNSTSLSSSSSTGALASWKINQSINQINSNKYGWEVVS